jgi:hypothetical protein
MPQPQKLEKAKLIEIVGDSQGKVVSVQFNPQSLKLNFSNQWQSSNDKQGQSTQFVGTSMTKLGMELWFDVTLPLPDGTPDPHGDVRNLTQSILYFMTVQGSTTDPPEKKVPPKLKFQWGSFVFNGTMDSMDENIDLFSADGVPQRASVTISLTKHDLKFTPKQAGGTGVPAGTTPLSLAKVGDTLQQMAAKAGISNWQSVAQANGITNPRLLQPGTMINLSLKTS